ncbi:MAG: PstC family ABC transporter permease, partial [Hominimerdicola sp.]
MKSALLENGMKVLFFICASVSILAVAVICIFMFAKGCPAIAEIGLGDFLLGSNWKPQDTNASFGIFPMIVGSVYCTAGAIIIGVPIGLMTAIYMAKFCPKKLYKWLMPPINLLAGIPSIVYGFFGMVVVVPFIRNVFGGTGNSILTVSIILGIMILPTIVGMSVSALNAVPDSYYEGAVALGATHERAVATVV